MLLRGMPTVPVLRWSSVGQYIERVFVTWVMLFVCRVDSICSIRFVGVCRALFTRLGDCLHMVTYVVLCKQHKQTINKVALPTRFKIFWVLPWVFSILGVCVSTEYMLLYRRVAKPGNGLYMRI